MPDLPEISADELATGLESGAIAQILDVRAPTHVAEGRIEGASRFVNLPNSRLFVVGEMASIGLDPGRPVAVVCDMGISSRQSVAFLRARGFREATSLRGGMAAWMEVVTKRPIRDVLGLDAVLQFDRPGKAALGYLLARAGAALVVDPGRRTAPYVEAARSLGAKIVGVLDTHCHADYLSGGAALAASLQVPYLLHPADATDPFDGRPARIPFFALSEGERIRLGDAELVVESTPGHTDGSVSIRLEDQIALTGDFVFVQSLGRPDIAGRTEEWTGRLWRSLERAKREWPQPMRILPAHYATESERGADRTVAATFGDVLAHGGAFSLPDLAAFRTWVAERIGACPAAYREIKAANLGLRLVDESLAAELEGGRNRCALAS